MYLVCGSEDGSVWVWDAEYGGPPTAMPAMRVGGQPTYAVAWSPCLHLAACCSFSPWAPIVVAAYEPGVPEVHVAQPAQELLDAMRRKQQLEQQQQQVRRQ